VNLKAQEDVELPKEKHYIRRIIVIDHQTSPRHEEDEEDNNEQKDDKIRIIICMTSEASRLRP
jgi:D-lyxose ketol-isomerase